MEDDLGLEAELVASGDHEVAVRVEEMPFGQRAPQAPPVGLISGQGVTLPEVWRQPANPATGNIGGESKIENSDDRGREAE